jgi:hypothetical protein
MIDNCRSNLLAARNHEFDGILKLSMKVESFKWKSIRYKKKVGMLFPIWMSSYFVKKLQVAIWIVLQVKWDFIVPAEVPILKFELAWDIFFLLVFENDRKALNRAKKRIGIRWRGVFANNGNSLKRLFGCFDGLVCVFSFDLAIILSELISECTDAIF